MDDGGEENQSSSREARGASRKLRLSEATHLFTYSFSMAKYIDYDTTVCPATFSIPSKIRFFM
jgi:hypothetical protein